MPLKLKSWRKVMFLAGAFFLALGGNISGGGEPEKKAASEAKPAEGQPKKDDPSAPPAYKPGPDLNGYFDRTVLRSLNRVSEYRYPLEDLRQVVNAGTPTLIRINCVLEFGSEAGMAEVDAHKKAIVANIIEVMGLFRPQDLITVPGKIRLKEAIAAAINHKLTTARVRQVYLTDILMQK